MQAHGPAEIAICYCLQDNAIPHAGTHLHTVHRRTTKPMGITSNGTYRVSTFGRNTNKQKYLSVAECI
jgi:hypothetical protein